MPAKGRCYRALVLLKIAAPLISTPRFKDTPTGQGVVYAVSASLFLSLLTASVPVSSASQSPQDSTDSSRQLIAKARDAEQKHDFQTAAELYQDYLNTHPNDSEILQRLGLVNCLSNRFEATIPPLKKALQLDSSLWGSALYLGISYYHTGRFADAAAVLKRALLLKPDLAEADFWMGASLLFTGQPESAIPHLLRASKNQQLNAQAQYFLVKAYRKAAEDHYQRISTVAPDSCLVHLVKAQSLAWRGSSNGAVWEAREALKRNPEVEGAHRLIAEVFWQEKGFEASAKEFQAELEINPLDPESNLRLGEISLAKGDTEKAISFLNLALSGSAGLLGENYHFLGEAELARHNYEKATAHLKRAVQENPDDPSNHRLLAAIYRASGRPDLAAKEEALASSGLSNH